LELGSGCGLSGIACSAMGANVWLTDQKQVIHLLKMNSSMNKERCKGKITVQELDWETWNSEQLQNSIPFHFVIGNFPDENFTTIFLNV